MKAYLATTGAIFGLFAIWHVVEIAMHWQVHTTGFMVSLAVIAIVSGVLSLWAFRLLRAIG